MHRPPDEQWSYDTLLALQVVLLAVFSGVVSWMQRWRDGGYSRRHLREGLLIDICTSMLVGFSVYLTARHHGWEPDAALGTAIVAGHYGARWIGTAWHDYQALRATRATEVDAADPPDASQ